ncbi:MAG: phosphotyrosine protein phosphatase [Candidatus Woesearchaeota archaeon]|nr:phosphotyrosine protein phosphatase [Candidatus Woesearchaeota archaeon]
MKALFVCSYNHDRSKTAEEIFKGSFEVRSAGLFNNPVSEEQILWADIIFVMEEFQVSEIKRRFPKTSKRIVCLDISDEFSYMQPELISLLKIRLKEFLHS